MSGRALGPELRRLALTMVLGAALALINTTIVGVALPVIGIDFGAGLETLTWVGTGYVLALAVAILISGWAMVTLGLRRTWWLSLVVFAFGSLLASVSPWVGMLIAARVLQGLGGGMLEPVMLTTIALAAGPSRMGRAMGLVAAVIGVGPLIGPVLGGLVIDLLDWRWMFGLFVPLAVAALVLSRPILPDGDRDPRRLDAPGLLLLTLGAGGLLLGLSRAAGSSGLGAGGTAALVVGAALLVAYGPWAARRGAAAVVSLRPARTRGFVPAALIMLLLGAAIYPLFFGLPQFFQGARGLGALASGLLMVPQGLGALVGMSWGGRLSDSWGSRRLVLAGSSVTALANLIFVGLGVQAPLAAYAGVLLVSGLGVGFVGGPTVSSLYRVLAPADIPSGSVILFVANQIGGALGIAVMAALIGASAAGEPTWSVADGTTPMLLPAVGALAIAIAATRLPSAPAPLPEPSQTRPGLDGGQAGRSTGRPVRSNQTSSSAKK